MEFLRRVRDERRFENPEALRAQILKDRAHRGQLFPADQILDRAGTLHFILSGLSIVLIDLLLAGDNALVIAMAVRSLPAKQRRTGIICGAGAAVALRVGLTFIAGLLLNIPYVQLVGGLLVLWIAVTGAARFER